MARFAGPTIYVRRSPIQWRSSTPETLFSLPRASPSAFVPAASHGRRSPDPPPRAQPQTAASLDRSPLSWVIVGRLVHSPGRARVGAKGAGINPDRAGKRELAAEAAARCGPGAQLAGLAHQRTA